MPTGIEFAAAAELFAAAAERVAALTGDAVRSRPEEILRGGSLGRQVPDRIYEAAQTTLACQEQILAAEFECRRRAGIIATYEAALVIYDRRHAHYAIDVWYWDGWFDSWIRDPGANTNPGPRPIPPDKPTPPPQWADVRRP